MAAEETSIGAGGKKNSGIVIVCKDCSLDSNPGNGDPDDGDPWGQLNGTLLWNSEDSIDENNRWEMSVYLANDTPDDMCRVDLTPRHCRKFKPKPGNKFKWSITSLDGKEILQNGVVTADQWGLVTLPAIQVTRGKTRIKIVSP